MFKIILMLLLLSGCVVNYDVPIKDFTLTTDNYIVAFDDLDVETKADGRVIKDHTTFFIIGIKDLANIDPVIVESMKEITNVLIGKETGVSEID